MNLSEHIGRATARRETKSVVKNWIETLSPEDQQVATQNLKDPNVGTTALHKAFTEYGAEFSKYAVETYRKKMLR